MKKTTVQNGTTYLNDRAQRAITHMSIPDARQFPEIFKKIYGIVVCHRRLFNFTVKENLADPMTCRDPCGNLVPVWHVHDLMRAGGRQCAAMLGVVHGAVRAAAKTIHVPPHNAGDACDACRRADRKTRDRGDLFAFHADTPMPIRQKIPMGLRSGGRRKGRRNARGSGCNLNSAAPTPQVRSCRCQTREEPPGHRTKAGACSRRLCSLCVQFPVIQRTIFFMGVIPDG